MILKDSKGNELVEIINIDENSAMAEFSPVTHCLAVVTVGNDYLLGWNKWRKDWEIFGGLYGIRLQPEDMQKIEKYRLDREEIEKVELLKDIGADEPVAEIDRDLLKYYGQGAER